MSSDRPYKITNTRNAYQNPWITVKEDTLARSDGTTGIYGYLDVAESVCIVAVDAEKRICIVESYRHPFDGWFWELPGGGAEKEDPVRAAARELQEEAAITATDWTIMGKTRVYNGLSNEYQANVLATGLTIKPFRQTEEETRNRRFVSMQELDDMIKAGAFADNQSIVALYAYKLHLAGN